VTDLLSAIIVVFEEDAPEVKVPFVFVHAVAFAGVLFWLYPQTRKKASRFAVPGLAGLICFYLAFWKPDWLWRWDAMFEHWLVPIAPRAFVAFHRKFMYPMVYFFGAWLLGFALAFYVVLSLEKNVGPSRKRRD
jgi:hypothetical protein